MNKCYNTNARYEIIGRVLQGTSVTDYILRDRNEGNEIKVEKCIVEQLALNKQIYNCSAQLYKDTVNMKGLNCKISSLPRYNDDGIIIDSIKPAKKKKAVADLEIIGKIQNGRSISDYVVISLLEPTTKMKVPKDIVLQLALDGRVINAKVQMNNGEPMLRGKTKESLSQLALYRA